MIALDLGGVLVDVDHLVLSRMLGVPQATIEAAFFDDDLHDRVTVGAIDGDEFIEEAARRLALPAADIRAAWAAVVNVTPPGRALVVDLLARGHVVHLWSNTDPIHLERMAAQLPHGPVLTTASCQLGAMKPHPAYFTRALALGVPAVFLDDREDNVAAALLAGVDAERCLGAERARAILVTRSLLG